MITAKPKELELLKFWLDSDPSAGIKINFPIDAQTGAASTAAVYFELERGKRLGRHTDSAEEVLVVLAGEVDVIVGDERRSMQAGAMAVVPAEAPHDVVGTGDGIARVTGVFPSSTVVSVFDDEWLPYGTRVLGTPPPVETAVPS